RRDHQVQKAAVAVALFAVERDAVPFGRAIQPIADEDVERVNRVAGYEVVGARRKRHKAAIGADRGDLAVVVALDAATAQADQFEAWARRLRGGRRCRHGRDNREREGPVCGAHLAPPWRVAAAEPRRERTAAQGAYLGKRAIAVGVVASRRSLRERGERVQKILAPTSICANSSSASFVRLDSLLMRIGW